MRRGFSLVEMLVAVLLLSLLIGVAVFSFRMQLIVTGKARRAGIHDAIVASQLRGAIESMKYYAVQDYDFNNLPVPRTWHDFFEGDTKRLRFITTHPVLKNVVALVELECVEGRLNYYEKSLYGPMDFLRPAFGKDRPKPVILYRDLQECRFSYLDRSGRRYARYAKHLPRVVEIGMLGKDRRPVKFFVTIKSDNNLTSKILESDIEDEM